MPTETSAIPYGRIFWNTMAVTEYELFPAPFTIPTNGTITFTVPADEELLREEASLEEDPALDEFLDGFSVEG